MLHITFEYHDELCQSEKWNRQSCICSSVQECIKWYGLDQCDYRIISVEKIK